MNTMISSNEINPKKKSRSLVSFFLNKQSLSTPQISDMNINRKTMKDDVIVRNQPSPDIDLTQYKRNPTLTYSQRQSVEPNFNSSLYYQTELPIKDNNQFNRYRQLFGEFIDENDSCFGFSLFHRTSKYCVYMTTAIFLGICLIISLTAVFKP